MIETKWNKAFFPKIESITPDDIEYKMKDIPVKYVLQFLNYSHSHQDYLTSHEKLIKIIWKFVDASYETSLNNKQRQNVQKIISITKNIRNYLPENITIIGQDDIRLNSNRLLFFQRCPNYFQTKLNFSQRTNQSLDEINFSDLSKEALEIIKKFIETSEVSPIQTPQLAEEVFYKAGELGFTEFEEKFLQNGEVTLENALFYFKLSISLNLIKLKLKALNCLRSYMDPSFLEATQLLKDSRQNDDFRELESVALEWCIRSLKKQLSKIAEADTESVFEEVNFLETFKEEDLQKILKRLAPKELIVLMKLYPKSIPELNLSVYDDHEIASIVQFLPPSLEGLDLSGTALSSKTMDIIAMRCQSLKKLILTGARKWNEKDPLNSSKENWVSLTSFQNLTELKVSQCEDAAPYLEEMLLMNAHHLVSFDMSGSEGLLGDRCLKILGKFGECLKELNISRMYISESRLQELYLNKSLCRSLEKLSLAGNTSLENQHLKEIGSNFCHLRSLDLDQTKLDERTLEEILSKLGGYSDEEGEGSKLEELKIGLDDVVEIIAKYSPKLKTLRLYSRYIKDVEIDRLIQGCPEIKRLDLPKTSKDGFIKLVNHYPCLVELLVKMKWLDYGTHMGQRSNLEEHIKKLTSLETLEFEIERSNKGLIKFLNLNQILPYLPKLQKLKCLVSDINKAIQEITECCPEITELDLDHYEYTSRGVSNGMISEDSFRLLVKLPNLKKFITGSTLEDKTSFSIIRAMPSLKWIRLNIRSENSFIRLLQEVSQLETLEIKVHSKIDSILKNKFALGPFLRELFINVPMDGKLHQELCMTHPRLKTIKAKVVKDKI